MAIPSRMQDRILVVSDKKQTNYSTILTDVNLQAGKRFAPNAPVFGQPEPRFFTDRARSMKGHDYATLRKEVERELSEQLSFDGDSWLLAWAAAFAMGKVTSVQPNAGGNPTAYLHTIKPLDPGVDGKDLPVTTIYTEVANVAALKRRLHSIAFREFGIEFPPNAPVQLTAAIVGSGQITTGALATPPSLATDNLLYSNDMVFSYGAQAGPTDITSQIVRGSVRFGFTWNIDDDNARHVGSGLYRARAWVTSPNITLEFQRLVDDTDSTANDEWLAGTVREIKVYVGGATIGPGPEKHDLEIRGLAVIPEGVRVGQAGDKSVYQYSIGPEHWLKQGSSDVVTIKVTNLQTSYLT